MRHTTDVIEEGLSWERDQAERERRILRARRYAIRILAVLLVLAGLVYAYMRQAKNQTGELGEPATAVFKAA